MTEQDLADLRLAAKAAGHEVDSPYSKGLIINGGILWNPRDDDGDAFRLAARMRIDIHFEDNGPTLGEIVEASFPKWGHVRGCMAEQCGDDPAKAARHAIFRAAVEIGGAIEGAQ